MGVDLYNPSLLRAFVQELALDITQDIATFAIDYLPIFLIVAFLVAFLMWILAHLSRYFEYLKMLESPYLDKETLDFIHKVLIGLGVGMIVILIFFVLQFRIPEIKQGLVAFIHRVPALFFVIFVIFIAAILVRIIHRFAGYLRGDLKVKPRRLAPPRALSFTEIFLKYLIYTIAGVIAFIGGISALPPEDQEYKDIVFSYIAIPDRAVILGFIVAIIAIFIVLKFTDSIFEDMKKRTTKFSPKAVDEFKSTVKYTIYLAGIVIVLILALDILLTFEQLLIFTVAIIFGGLVATIIMFDIIRNGLAGVTLMLTNPFNVGDQIKVDNGAEYEVESIGLLATQVRALNGDTISFTNSKLLRSNILNISRSTSGIIQLTVALDFSIPHQKLEMAFKEAVEKTTGIELNPQPQIICMDIRGSSMEYQLLAHTKDVLKIVEIKSNLIMNLQDYFQRESLNPIVS